MYLLIEKIMQRAATPILKMHFQTLGEIWIERTTGQNEASRSEGSKKKANVGADSECPVACLME